MGDSGPPDTAKLSSRHVLRKELCETAFVSCSISFSPVPISIFLAPDPETDTIWSVGGILLIMALVLEMALL